MRTARSYIEYTVVKELRGSYVNLKNLYRRLV